MTLMPKKTKFRKMQKGQFSGLSKGANFVHFGEFGMQVLERGWITNQQIEACRVAINRYFQRRGKVWIRIFPISLSPRSLQRFVWVREKALSITTWLLCVQAEFYLKSAMFPEKWLKALYVAQQQNWELKRVLLNALNMFKVVL